MLRLVLLIILLLASLLAIFKAPTYHAWLLAIIISEFPIILLALTSLILIAGVWVNKYQFAGTVIGLIALLLLVSPIVKAYSIAKVLKLNISEAFGGKIEYTQSVFSFSSMFNIFNNKGLASESFTYSSNNLTLDFYSSRKNSKRPCIVVVHGGSWKSGDNKQLPELNSVLAKAGYNVAAINYRLAPQHLSPSPLEDVKNALSYLRARADELKIDTDNFVLLGRSAGAQIALLAAYTLNDTGIRGVVDFYGPADMVWGYFVPSNPWVMDSRKVMEDYLGGSYKSVPQNYIASSPINFVSRSSVPTLIIHGENDVLVAYEHSIKLHRKLKDYGVKNYFLSLPWATHGFDYNLYGPGGQLSTFAVKQFIQRITY